MTASTSSCAIRAEDFTGSTASPFYRRWTVKKLSAVVAALDGQLVAVTTDASTGHTEIGVKLIHAVGGYRGGMWSPRLRVERTFESGETQVTDFRIESIGLTIIPLDENIGVSGAKWVALDLYRNSAVEDHEAIVVEAVPAS